jgi:hypothetical protein
VRWRSDYKWIQGTILAIVHVRGTRFIHRRVLLTVVVVDNAKERMAYLTVEGRLAGYKGSHIDFSIPVDHLLG